jgi:short-subunit dehydrogenase
MPLALVTGASAGIGRAFAVALAQRRYDLVLVARSTARLEALAGELASRHGVRCECWPADLATDTGREEVAARIAALFRLDLLVNNAGFATTGKLHKIPLEPQMQMLRLHTLAPMRLCAAALPRMVEHGAGSIINVSSIAGFLFGPGNVNYSATKAFLTSLSLGLDTEVRDAGIRVQALCPGFTHTEIHTEMPHVKRQIPGWLWGSAERVVETSLRQIERGGPVICVPGLRNKLLWRALSLIPRGLRGKLAVRKHRGRSSAG